MKQMKFITGNFNNPIEANETSVKNTILENNNITLYGFETIEKADELVKKFPKYVKVKRSICRGSSFEPYGINEVSEGEIVGIEIQVMPVNSVTGEYNEAGEKRINKYIQVLKDQGYIK